MAERIVINTGPLIALARMDALDLPSQLPYEFICPSEVREELDEGISLGYQVIAPSWLTMIPLSASPSAASVAALDKGEGAVIQLALEQGLSRVSIDEVKGRRIATALGLSVVGSLGLVARAKVLGIIPAMRPLVEKAMREGVHYHADLIERVLSAVGE
jgi:predicted nucleic acid-binding protein